MRLGQKLENIVKISTSQRQPKQSQLKIQQQKYVDKLSYECPVLSQNHNDNIVVKSPFYPQPHHRNGPCQCPYHRLKRIKQIGEINRQKGSDHKKLQFQSYRKKIAEDIKKSLTFKLKRRDEIKFDFLKKSRDTDVDAYKGKGNQKNTEQLTKSLLQKRIKYEENHNTKFEQILKDRLKSLQDGPLVFKILKFVKSKVYHDPSYLKKPRSYMYNYLLEVAQKYPIHTIRNMQQIDEDTINVIGRILNTKKKEVVEDFIRGVQQALKDMERQSEFQESRKKTQIEIKGTQEEISESKIKQKQNLENCIHDEINEKQKASKENIEGDPANHQQSNAHHNQQTQINTYNDQAHENPTRIDRLLRGEKNTYDIKRIMLNQRKQSNHLKGYKKREDQQKDIFDIKKHGRNSRKSVLSKKSFDMFGLLDSVGGESGKQETNKGNQKGNQQHNSHQNTFQKRKTRGRQDLFESLNISEEKQENTNNNIQINEEPNRKTIRSKTKKKTTYPKKNTVNKVKNKETKLQPITKPQPKLTFCNQKEELQIMEQIDSHQIPNRLRNIFSILIRILQKTPEKFLSSLEELTQYITSIEKEILIKMYAQWEYNELIKKLIRQADQCLQYLKNKKPKPINWDLEQPINLADRMKQKHPTYSFDVESSVTSNKLNQIIKGVFKQNQNQEKEVNEQKKEENFDDQILQKQLGQVYLQQIAQNETGKLSKLKLAKPTNKNHSEPITKLSENNTPIGSLSKRSIKQITDLNSDNKQNDEYQVKNNEQFDEQRHKNILRFMRKQHPQIFVQVCQQIQQPYFNYH